MRKRPRELIPFDMDQTEIQYVNGFTRVVNNRRKKVVDAVKRAAERVKEVKEKAVTDWKVRKFLMRWLNEYQLIIDGNVELSAYRREIVGTADFMNTFLEFLQEIREIKSNTVVSYARTLMNVAREMYPEAPLGEMRVWLKGKQLEVMSATIRRAIDITDALAIEIIATTNKFDIKADIWKMTVSGGRCEDLKRALDLFVSECGRYLIVLWGETKTDRKIAHRRQSKIFIPEDLRLNRFIGLHEYIPSNPNAGLRTLSSTYSAIMRRLAKVEHGDLPEGRRITTYSFRRCYIQRVISYCTLADETVDWEKVCLFTGHRSTDMPQNVYALTHGKKPLDCVVELDCRALAKETSTEKLPVEFIDDGTLLDTNDLPVEEEE